MKQSLPRPTDGELAILRVLWSRGPSTVRQVHEALNQVRQAEGQPGRKTAVGYTTVLRAMLIMLDKGLVNRNEDERTHVYQACESEEHTQRHLVRDLLGRVFGGSSLRLVLQALHEAPLSPEEEAEVRRLLGKDRP